LTPSAAKPRRQPTEADAKDKDNIGCIKSADARPAKFLENRSSVDLNDCLQKRVQRLRKRVKHKVHFNVLQRA
jgi:hypothetical protein